MKDSELPVRSIALNPSYSDAEQAEPVKAEEAYFERETIRRVAWKLVPFLFIAWFVNYLDRASIGVAALQMNKELGLGPEAFGFAAGIFYVGYVLFEVPSNMLMHRFGARRWLARILFMWGAVLVATAFVRTPLQLDIARFLLGSVEAGLLPAIMYYLGLWFPTKYIGKPISIVYVACIISLIVGAPLCSFLMSQFNETGSFLGWRWMMLLEGAMGAALGLVARVHLVDRPDEAKWLTHEQRAWLTGEMAKTAGDASRHGTSSARKAFSKPIVWFLGFLYFCVGIAFFGISTWMPQVINQMTKLTLMQIGWVSSFPFALGAVAMILNAKHSDRTLERRWHLTGALALGMVGMFGSGLMSKAPELSYLLICLSTIGLVGSLGVFWTIPPTFLAGAGAAGGMALINAISSLSGLVGPWLIGVVRSKTTDVTTTLYWMAISLVLAALLAALLPYPNPRDAARAKSS
ncbi:MFS transporter [Burkholderia lata]|uniref:MFS transporter n=1 Tax=Burkholderia lata (strain ATCC 17760 / DSM 23089 / LMG 22485 / NCIMB 9086 / R18194 / 383) TaxID=482957 RepID=UPI00145349B1|nr:MFS transporter [Burkholderia lata]VWC21254.1 membrane protein [Burkholderia lata]